MPKSRQKMPDYQCFRCGYETPRKDLMRKHFNKVKACQGCVNNIDLTDAIKECILENRIYIPEKTQTIQLINNYKFVSKFIGHMETTDKLSCLLDYHYTPLLDYEQHLDNKFEKRIKRLQDQSFKAPYVLGLDNLLEVVSLATQIEPDRIEQFCVIFDKRIGRIKIYRGKEWESYIEDVGARELISLIKSYYLDHYETYLIKSLYCETSRVTNRQSLREHIEIYYKFIAVFDLSPCVLGMTDKELIGHVMVDGNEHFLEAEYMRLYHQQKKQLKTTEKNRITKKIMKVINDNTMQNLQQLDEVLINILKIDDTFRQQLFDGKQMLMHGEVN